MEVLELIQLVYKECIGPKKGLFEELEARGRNKFDPHWDYISGVLYSRTLVEEKKEIFREEEYEINEEEEFIETEVLDPLAKPTTIGLSFNFEADKDAYIDIAISYGIYRKEGNKYKREPRLHILKNIQISKVNTYKIPLKDEGIFCYIKRLENNISIKIYNYDFSVSGQKNNDVERCIYQPQIRIVLHGVRLKNNGNINTNSKKISFDDELVYAINKAQLDKPVKGNICSVLWKEIDFQNTDLIKNKNVLEDKNTRKIIEDVPFKWIDGEVLLNPQYRKYLYIYNLENYSFNGTDREKLEDIKDNFSEKEFINLYQKFEKPDLRTELMPIIPFPLPTLETNLGICLNPEYLAECKKEDLISTLKKFRQKYEDWIKKQPVTSTIEEEILGTHKEALRRIGETINKIDEDFTVEMAFRFANKAIAQSIKWKDKNFLQRWNWRPFQIGYILLVLNSIIDPSDRYRDVVDILWIPTGGGKTEAYLAIIAFTIAWRRLQQIYKWEKLSQPNEPILGDYGTVVLSRYTLRLLSSQQIIRTLKVITAMEFLRSKNWIPEPYKNDKRLKRDYLWGRQRISLGYLVGGEATPNNMLKALRILKDEESAEYMRATNAKFIMTCPVCETYIAIPNELDKDEEIKLFLLFENMQEKLPMNISNAPECSIRIHKIHDYWKNIKSVEINIKANTNLDLNKSKIIEEIVRQIEKSTGSKYLGIHPTAPGYIEVQWKRNILKEDFEIVCPNPECDLNKQSWKELVPNLSGNSIHFEDLKKFCSKNKWIFERVPIPIFFVDEKIFYQLPSVIIATVDKFAQIPLEEKSRYSHIFNYVNEACCGVFNRNSKSENMFFIPPPNLVLQDELHLIQGTLGSLVGFYETMVAEFLTAKYKTKFNSEIEFTPKYIASSATIKNVEEQVKRIFKYRNTNKPAHFLFPPYSLNLFDDFYVVYKHYYVHPVDMVLQNLRGRIYVGLFAPGRPPAMQTRKVYTPLLSYIKNKQFSNTHPYRTIVGYYNSLKELGIAQSIIIHEVRDTIRQHVYWRELSSNIHSSRIPVILKELESGKFPVDVLFTTSMFGTGVDIPRLSLMVMDGMPKLVADYIQATGRVGRNNTAVVFTLLNSKRVREIVLYEFFSNFHRNLYKFVEHIPVYPFTKKILKKAGGCLLVGLLRNSRRFSPDWKDNNLTGIAKTLAQKESKFSLYMKDIEDAIKIIQDRNAIQGNYGLPSSFNFCKFLVTNTSNGFLKIQDIYKNISRKSIYFFKHDSKKQNPRVLVTLEQKEVLLKKLGSRFCCVYENIPTSLRNVEESFSIILWGEKKCKDTET